MSLNIFTLSFRNIRKHKGLALTNIIGLTFGFTAFILISLFVKYEYDWDKHNTNFDRVYRVQRHFIKDLRSVDGTNISPHSNGFTAKILTQNCPEIEKTMILYELKAMYLSNGDKKLIFDKTGMVIDASVFDLFSFNFIQGNRNNALIEPNTIVLSETMARKLFANGDALGKTVIAEKKFHLKVTGVYADLPLNSHLRPEYMISMATIAKRDDVYNNPAGHYMTYILMKPGTDIANLGTKVYDLFKENNIQTEKDVKLELCPLSKIHLSFNGNKDYMFILFLYNLIGILILVLSAINYINLTTANAAIRSKETVIKKVNGGRNWQIAMQFIGDSSVLAFIAVIFAIILANYLIIPFNSIIDKDLVLFNNGNVGFLLKTVLITMIIGVISGIYPAFFMTRYNAITLLKGNIFKGKTEVFSFRKILVGFQFLTTIFLIAFAIYVSSQIQYMLNKDLGFKKENMIYTKFQSSNTTGNYAELRNRIMQHPEIINMTIARHLPFISFGGGTTNWEGGAPDEITNIRDNRVGYDFFETLEIPILEGRNFSKDNPSDAIDKCIINETAVKTFGWNDPIGKRLNNNRLEVIGVVKDFHYKDMHNHIEPAIIRLYTGSMEGDISFAFRVSSNNYLKAQKILTREFESFFPDDPFEFHYFTDGFRDEDTFKVYMSVNNTVIFFTFLILLLAIIGLLGLITFITQRKTKEIGVRKINGSTSVQILLLLNKELFTIITVASIIASIFVIYFVAKFPGSYKRPFEPWMMLLAIGIVSIISFLVSLYHTYKAATSNPIDALRYE